jgi:RimJ/RimL family protein N-acetyltransferase
VTPDDRHTSDAANRYPRLERDYLVEVDGDLDAPRLEIGKHDAYAWVGADNLDLMMEGRIDGDRRLRDLVAKAVRTRLTERLRLEPLGPEHAADLARLHAESHVVEWYEAWTESEALAQAQDKWQRWERAGVSKWMAFHRETGEMVGRGGVDQLAVGNVWARAIAGLLRDTGWADHRLEVGWVVSSDQLGQGFATEIGRAGMDFARTALGARAVCAFTEVGNAASRAVMERLGMAVAGEFSGPIPSADGEPVRDARFVVYWANVDQI